MRFAFSFCYVSFVFLCYFVRTNSARPTSDVDDERKSKESYIVEVDPYALEAVAKEIDRKKPANYVTAVVRNKRHFDFSDYSSSSSEENNSFGQLLPKPQNNPHGFAYFWKYHRPAPHAGYQFWQPSPTTFYARLEFNRRPHQQPHHSNYHHHHSDEDCKYPFSDSNEYEYGDSGEISRGSTTQVPVGNGSEAPVTQPTTMSTTSTTTATTSTTAATTSTTAATTTTTTTTEYIPKIDIRSAN